MWEKDTSYSNYYASPPCAYLGMVPNMKGDVTRLETSTYDLSAYPHVLLRFKHICKVSPMDAVRIEYRLSGQGWKTIPAETYLGNAMLYLTKGFSAASYAQWQAGDSLALPNSLWWKEESFDVSFEVGSDNAVQFRFVIEHGNVAGTQISYGWLLDDIEIIAAPYEVKPPIVEFMSPFVQGIIYTISPHTIKGRVKTQSGYAIQTPWLIYTAILNNVSVTDSVLMKPVISDSVWEGIIPPFVLGTTVNYFITGKDIMGNYASSSVSNYIITKNPHNYGNYSAAVASIDSPLRRQTVEGVTTPVIATIRNKGDSALTSLDIYTSINGTVTSRSWTGNLSWDMADTVHLGNYIPRANMYDTIMIWISNPNNATDPLLSDDTANVIFYGCAATMSGPYTVGTGGAFASINDFLAVLKDCTPAGNIILLLQTGIYAENWDLTNISNFMGNHTLTITSSAAHADSVVIKPASGVGIVLSNSNDLMIKNITVDVTAGTYGILFTGACSNVTIRDCKLLANPIIMSTGYAPIYKGSSTGIVDSVFIINNLLDGGYYGFYLCGGSSSSYNKHIVFDSNTVSNQSSYATYFYYTDLTSCSYNTILSRTTNASSIWYGLYLYFANGPVTGNHIKQCTTAITTPHGILLYYYHRYNTTDTGLVANNEIILYTTGTYYGIYAIYTKAKILHNSIYISGSGAANGIYISNNANNYMVIKNNNIVMESTTAFPIYLSATDNLSLYDMDYNNMYAPTNIGYAGAAKTTMAAWQQTITTDKHSVSIRPEFVNNMLNLELVNYNGLDCDFLQEVAIDKSGYNRRGFTAMGCYRGFGIYSSNATLKDIEAESGLILGTSNTVKAILTNRGTNILTNATLNWSFNGVIQSSTGVNWTGNLALMAKDTVILGTVTYTPAGYYTIKAWIHDLGSQQDMFSEDDTTEFTAYICPSAMNGAYLLLDIFFTVK
jgi:hypothetical protein